MYCIKNVTDDLIWVGANDRRLAVFEGVYSVPRGVSYNSYLLLDEKTVLFDTVDKAVRQRFMENTVKALGGRELDYLVVQHMEPDHSAVIAELAGRYPGLKIVCNAKTLAFIKQFHGDDFDIESRALIVKENDTLTAGKHILHFIMAPMVHWPEVMVTYDSTDKILFSADAFGCFGALNGALFADEVDFTKDYMDEARRYYTNIVGKYGTQVRTLLDKASGIEIETICPLHGFVWRKNIKDIVSKYVLWSAYEPEDCGVMIAYASVYGNTENAAEILACLLGDKGIRTVMYDVSVTPASEVVAAAFRWSHFVFASSTYNAGIFVTMEALLNDLAAHNIQNRTAAVIENGSWAPTSGGLIRDILGKCRNINILDNTVSVKSGVKKEHLPQIASLADSLAASIADLTAGSAADAAAPAPGSAPGTAKNIPAAGDIDPAAMFKLSYGLFVLTARENGKDNGCIINTAAQITAAPLRVSVTVNKTNHTCGMLMRTGEFNISVLTESAPFAVFERFGFSSGKDTDKFAGYGNNNSENEARAANGVRYLSEHTNCVISAKITHMHDYDTHMLFTAEVTQAFTLSKEPSVTYQYYFDNIKPKPQAPKERAGGFVCKICGYVYEGDVMPAEFICPLCKHGASDFEKIQ